MTLPGCRNAACGSVERMSSAPTSHHQLGSRGDGAQPLVEAIKARRIAASSAPISAHIPSRDSGTRPALLSYAAAARGLALNGRRERMGNAAFGA